MTSYTGCILTASFATPDEKVPKSKHLTSNISGFLHMFFFISGSFFMSLYMEHKYKLCSKCEFYYEYAPRFTAHEMQCEWFSIVGISRSRASSKAKGRQDSNSAMLNVGGRLLNVVTDQNTDELDIECFLCGNQCHCINDIRANKQILNFECNITELRLIDLWKCGTMSLWR